MALLSAGQGLAQTRTITVVEGDTLEQLALRHGVDLDTLIAINGISDPTLLQVGQVLNLPAAAPVASRSRQRGDRSTTPRWHGRRSCRSPPPQPR